MNAPIPPLDLAHAKVALEIYEHGKRGLQTSVFAALVPAGDALHCPYCAGPVTSDNLFLIDLDERWNPVTAHTATSTVTVAANDHQPEDLYYRVACCQAPVTLPDRWQVAH